jgi:regulator of protease activity HflC (stomatin/prohibitin superfamily)
LFIDSYASYSVQNIEVAFKRLGTDFDQIVRTMSKGALKNVVGDFTMDQLLQDSQSLGVHVFNLIQPKLEPFGIQVSLVEIQNITLPQRLQRMMDMIIETQ